MCSSSGIQRRQPIKIHKLMEAVLVFTSPRVKNISSKSNRRGNWDALAHPMCNDQERVSKEGTYWRKPLIGTNDAAMHVSQEKF